MHKRLSLLFFLFVTLTSRAQIISPDDTKSAFAALEQLKTALQEDASKGEKSPELLDRMLRVGLWEAALPEILPRQDSLDYRVLLAKYHVLNNDFQEAEKVVNKALDLAPAFTAAILLKADLEVQAWRLEKAANTCQEALERKEDEALRLMLGRVRLLQKNYSSALKAAKEVMAKNPKSAGAHLLEADVYFWNQQPRLAEEPLRRSLELDPFNADARFSYGYAIWRRIDATQLDDMAAQWELALAINPLHYQTHWHWGNGHTNLTYEHYRRDDDEAVRKALESADAAMKNSQIAKAIAITREQEKVYPQSVLPLLYRASYYYMAFDMDRKARLDSAGQLFETILKKIPHYGPAHNGLSAVIKSKRIPYLAAYDSIEHALNNTRIRDLENFERVFTDMTYYPGKTVQAMVWNQMYSSTAYFPFLSKQGHTFHVPPLHIDLAIAMNSPFFRSATTFDNRQWMDIRGVGSGAAAIEYVERGAYLERNLVLHEFVHLFHGTVLTDAENRRIRQLYYAAMQENRTLDYYSQNNESEYFAQTFPAYFEPVRVHPLDFKSMNTTADLKSKDPAMWAFLDSLVEKNNAFLGGDKDAMADNWSQVYLNLSKTARASAPPLARRYLDTALSFKPDYLPVIIAYGRTFMEDKDWAKADEQFQKARSIDSTYAPLYVALSDLVRAFEQNNGCSSKDRIKFLQKAYDLETDYQEKAAIAKKLYETLYNQGDILSAIEKADEYAENGSTISTYLRDRRDDALAFGASLRAGLGFREPMDILKRLVEQKPQNYQYRKLWARALAQHGNPSAAIQTLQQANRILKASGSGRSGFDTDIAEYYLQSGKPDSARLYLSTPSSASASAQKAEIWLRLGEADSAKATFQKLTPSEDRRLSGEYRYLAGTLYARLGEKRKAIKSLREAISLNPYDIRPYRELMTLVAKKHRRRLKEDLEKVPFSPTLKQEFRVM